MLLRSVCTLASPKLGCGSEVKEKARFLFALLSPCTNFAPCMNEDNYLYSQPVLDFITVSTEFCKYLEQSEGRELDEFLHVMRGMLPMLYLKASMLGNVPEQAGWLEKKLTEADYDYVRGCVARILGEKDDFLDVFVEDFKYSEHPVLCTISENLADIYQQLRELVEAFREGYEETMQLALYEAMDEFYLQWGQKLLNSLRAIHDVYLSVRE